MWSLKQRLYSISLLPNTQNKYLEICKIPLSCTYILVPDFNLPTKVAREEVLQSLHCVIIRKACFIDTYGHITLETFHAYFSCYISHRAHKAMSQLGWTRPVLIEAGIQSVNVHRSSGWSPYRSQLLPFLSSHF